MDLRGNLVIFEEEVERATQQGVQCPLNLFSLLVAFFWLRSSDCGISSPHLRPAVLLADKQLCGGQISAAAPRNSKYLEMAAPCAPPVIGARVKL
jgi:hypothetical protein